MSEALHRRVRAIRERLAIRAWEYRQRDHSKGVWFRLRRALVDAASAFSIDDADADRLAAEGFEEIPVGSEVHPPKRIFFVWPDRVVSLDSRHAVAVRLGADLLAARNLVLVPHEPKGRPAP
jgi:hypothetical protein